MDPYRVSKPDPLGLYARSQIKVFQYLDCLLHLLRIRLDPQIKEPIRMVRRCVIGVGISSVGFALAGRSAFELLEGSYALSMAGPLAPLVLGVHFKFGGEWAAVSSLTLGYAVIGIEMIGEAISPGYFDPWLIPLPILSLLVSTAAYLLFARLEGQKPARGTPAHFGE